MRVYRVGRLRPPEPSLNPNCRRRNRKERNEYMFFSYVPAHANHAWKNCVEALREIVPTAVRHRHLRRGDRIRLGPSVCHIYDNLYIFQRNFTYISGQTGVPPAASARAAERLSGPYLSHAPAI